MMLEVYETKKIPENCSTCLYGGCFGCGNANRKNDWYRYMMLGGCPSYWLNQHKYVRADERRW